MPTIIKLKRGTLERWDEVNPVLENGEPGVCYNNDDITMKIGDGVKTWSELPTQTYTRDQLNAIINQETSGSTNSTVSKISLGNIPDSTDSTYPATFNTTLGNNRKSRYYPDLYNMFDTTYKNFLWTVTWSDGTNGVKEQQYETINDLANYLIDNTPNNGNNRTASYSIECVAKQTDDIGKINKIYGMNKFFSILKGKGNYKQRIGHMGNVYDDLSYPKKDEFIQAVWNYFYPDLVYGTEDSKSFAPCTWMASNYHTMYGLLKPGNTIMFSSPDGKGRKNWNWGDSSTHNHINETMTVESSVLVGLSSGGSSTFEIVDTVKDKKYNDNKSYVRVYKMTGISGVDNITCLYIKPVGVDTFRLNYVPNAANLDLYMYVYNGWGDDQPLVRKLSNVYWNNSVENQMMSDLSFIVYKENWMWATINSSTQKHIGETKQKRFRFFLSDGKGNISTFSPEVYPYTHKTGAKSRTKINGM